MQGLQRAFKSDHATTASRGPGSVTTALLKKPLTRREESSFAGQRCTRPRGNSLSLIHRHAQIPPAATHRVAAIGDDIDEAYATS